MRRYGRNLFFRTEKIPEFDKLYRIIGIDQQNFHFARISMVGDVAIWSTSGYYASQPNISDGFYDTIDLEKLKKMVFDNRMKTHETD